MRHGNREVRVPISHPLRVLVLVLAIAAFFTTVVWHSAFHRRFMEPMLRFTHRGQPIPGLFRNPQFGRAWNSLVVLILIVLWWFLGTHEAMRIFRS